MFSHKLGRSIGIQMSFEFLAIDVSTAFLRGLRFQDLDKKTKDMGFEIKSIHAQGVAFVSEECMKTHDRDGLLQSQ